MTGWEHAHVDELDRYPVGEHGLEWRPVRRRFDIRAFGTNAYTAAEPGAEIVEPHTESRLQHEELYFVLRGHATFTLDDADVDAPAGTFVFLRDPAVRRVAHAVDAETVVLAFGGKPGEAYEPSAWESWFVAGPLAKQGRIDEALAVMEEELSRRPDHPATLYNLACIEALADRRDEALEHLNRSLELDPSLGRYVAEDSDLDPLRDDPRFPNAAGT